jgi:hypothetical protein
VNGSRYHPLSFQIALQGSGGVDQAFHDSAVSCCPRRHEWLQIQFSNATGESTVIIPQSVWGHFQNRTTSGLSRKSTADTLD